MDDNPVARPQVEKFKDAARELSADQDETRWEERLIKVVKAAHEPRPPPSRDPQAKKGTKKRR